MKQHVLRFFALIAALALSLLSLSVPAFAATRNDDTPHTMCLNDYNSHPNGWIITQMTTFGCGLDSLVTIAPAPTTLDTICAISSLPPAFLIIEEHADLLQDCGLFGSIVIVPASEIQPGPLDVCATSPIPPSWITIAETRIPLTASTCFSDGLIAKVNPAYPIERTIEAPPLDWHLPHPVCADSTLPPGFVRFSYTVAYPACQLDLGSPVIIRSN